MKPYRATTKGATPKKLRQSQNFTTEWFLAIIFKGGIMADVLYEKERTQEDAAAPTGRKEITSDRYLSRDMLDQEWEHLWPRTWLYAGVASDVSEPGEYFVFNIGPESILVSMKEKYLLSIMHVNIGALASWLMNAGGSKILSVPTMVGRIVVMEP